MGKMQMRDTYHAKTWRGKAKAGAPRQARLLERQQFHNRYLKQLGDKGLDLLGLAKSGKSPR